MYRFYITFELRSAALTWLVMRDFQTASARTVGYILEIAMLIGIDGDMWYCSNGLCLGDPRAEFTFERTLREAADKFREEFKCCDAVPDDLIEHVDKTPEEFKALRI